MKEHPLFSPRPLAKADSDPEEDASSKMARSAGKSAYQGKPHIGPSEAWDAGCRFAVPKAPDCACFSRRAKPRVSRYGAFPEDSVAQVLVLSGSGSLFCSQCCARFCQLFEREPEVGTTTGGWRKGFVPLFKCTLTVGFLLRLHMH